MFRWVFFLIVLVSLLYSCADGPDNGSAEEELTSEPAPPDSTTFFDSVYSPYKTSLDTFFRNKFEQTHFYGTVLFAQRGRVIFENNYGYANLKTKDTLTLGHTFQLASASKPFTAVAIMQLVEEGKIALSDEMHKFFPIFPYDGITIEQLLAHRSGMSQYTHFCDAPDTIWPDKHKTITNNDVINIMNNIVPMVNYAPNQTHYYCNTNYMLLASIVEKVSGMTFEKYLEKHIFEPCMMTSTKVYNRENFDELILPTIGYNGAFNPTIDIYLNGVVGDKGVYSNVEDMLKFDLGLYDGRLLNDTTVKLMMQDHNEMQNNGQNYGFGFRIYPAESTDGLGRIVFHTGWWKGFRTYFIRVPHQEKTIVVLSHIKRGKFLDVRELVGLIKDL